MRPVRPICPKCKLRPRKENNGYCRPCGTQIQRDWRAANPVRSKQKDKEWKTKNPEKYKHNKTASVVKRNYGITLVEKELIRKYQNYRCAVCKGVLKIANVDHCHATGLTRGLLCWHCNNALGKFRDNPTMLRAAAQYLETPTAELALGEKRYGLPGRITTKRARRLMLAKKSGVPLVLYINCAPELLEP
jgi:hypothetical protein